LEAEFFCSFAARDLREIVAYIAHDNPAAAERFGLALVSGLSRSRLYELLAQGRIRSICLRSHRDALRGLRLVDRESIDLFMESLQEVVSSLSTDEA
jgi:plasmid stabilization system protein ParE